MYCKLLTYPPNNKYSNIFREEKTNRFQYGGTTQKAYNTIVSKEKKTTSIKSLKAKDSHHLGYLKISHLTIIFDFLTTTDYDKDYLSGFRWSPKYNSLPQ